MPIASEGRKVSNLREFMKIRALFLGLILMIIVVSPVPAYAQTPTNAGALQQQIERESKVVAPSRKSVPRAEIITDSKNTSAKDTLKITVKNFRFDGNKLLDETELTKIVEPYLNHPINFVELQNAAAAVGEAYRVKGWVVRSFVPEQSVKSGVVTIKIIEAKLSKTKLEGDADINMSKEKVISMINAQQQENEPINTKKLDRALLLVDDLPGVSVSGRLREGERYGETDLVLKQTKEAMLTGAAIVDNAGSRSTGKERAHGFTQIINPFGIGDLASIYVLGSEGVGFARFEQSFPVGDDGWRVGANASIMHYDLVSREFKSLDGEGSSESFGLQAVYPVVRERQKNLYLNLNYDQKYFDNNSQGVASSNYDIKSGTLTLNGNIIDKIAGGGTNNAGFGVNFGQLDLHSLDSGEDANIEGNFRKISYNISRQQTLTDVLAFYASFSGQASPERKLDSSEMFYLGGPQGVRAYPVSEGSGVDGNIFSAELRWNFLPDYQLTGFYDHGYAHNSGSVDSYSLDGAGLELSLQSKSGFNVNASWAHRIGDNPNPTTTGDDQDGSLLKNRFWLTISKRF